MVKRGSHFAVSVICGQEEGSGRKIKQRDQAVRSSLEVCPTRVIEAIDRTAAVGIANNRGIVPELPSCSVSYRSPRLDA